MNTLIIYAHGADVGPWMQALYFSFGLGCFIAPLLVHLSMETFDTFSAFELEVEKDLHMPDSM